MSRLSLCAAVCALVLMGGCNDELTGGSDPIDPPEEQGCVPECEAEQVCVQQGGLDVCVDRESLASGDACLSDSDCPDGQGCLDLGNNVKACQLLCEPEGEQSICDNACVEVGGRGFCQCNPFEPNCGGVFCINGPESGVFCGPCRSSGDLVNGSITDQCCGPNDAQSCRALYNNSPAHLEASNLAACIIDDGAQTGVCGISGEVGVNLECIENRDCAQGQRCIAEFGEPCAEAGLDDSERCLICQ